MTTNKGKSYSNLIYVIFGLLFLLLTNISYINFKSHEKHGFRYTGANPYASADKLVYMSMIEQGREGILFMKNLHTTDPQKGLMLSPHWYIIGQTARILHISNSASYQAYRLVLVALFLWLLYYVLKQLFSRAIDRNLAAAIVLFSGGLGWLYVRYHEYLFNIGGQIRFFHIPTDLYVTEGNTLLNFSQAPLFSLSQILIVLIFYLYVRYRKKHSFWTIGAVAALVIVLGVIHPYDMPIIFAVLGSWSVWYLYEKKQWKIMAALSIVIFAGLCAGAYQWYSFYAEPVLQEWLSQNLVYSPPLRNYLWGYGMLLPLWLIGCIQIIREKRHSPWWMLMLIWSCIVWILLYLPINLNRRFINGWHIPLAIIAYYGFRFSYHAIQRKWLKIAWAVTAFAVLFSTLGWYRYSSTYINLSFTPGLYNSGYYYITTDEENVISFLRGAGTPSDLLLTSDAKTSFVLTSELNRAVFRGHDHQTPQAQLRQQEMDWFFAEPETPEALQRKTAFVQDRRFNFIVVNRVWLGHSAQWLENAEFVKSEFVSGPFTVYRVL